MRTRTNYWERMKERMKQRLIVSMSMHGSQRDLNYYALARWVSSSHERLYNTAYSKKCLLMSRSLPFCCLARERKNENEWKTENKILGWQSLFSNNSPCSRIKVADFQKWTLNVFWKLKHWRMLSIELRLYI